MDPRQRPYRSVLYIPGSKERALDKARTLPVDAIIFDLEDAVAADEKENARETLKEALAAGGYGARVKIVRINGLDTEWGRADAEAVRDMDADAVLLPKVELGCRCGCAGRDHRRSADLGDDGNAARDAERRRNCRASADGRLCDGHQ